MSLFSEGPEMKRQLWQTLPPYAARNLLNLLRGRGLDRERRQTRDLSTDKICCSSASAVHAAELPLGATEDQIEVESVEIAELFASGRRAEARMQSRSSASLLSLRKCMRHWALPPALSLLLFSCASLPRELRHEISEADNRLLQAQKVFQREADEIKSDFNHSPDLFKTV